MLKFDGLFEPFFFFFFLKFFGNVKKITMFIWCKEFYTFATIKKKGNNNHQDY